MAVRADGTLAAWGFGTAGQTNIPPGLSNVISVAAGDAHSAALRRDGTVVVWGGNTSQKQTNMPAGLMQVVAIRAGGSQTLALRENGDVVGWGGSPPFSVPPYLHGVAQVSASPVSLTGSGLDLALLTNGTVTAWDGSGWPTNMFPGISDVMAVEAAGGSRGQDIGPANTCMILQSNGLVSGWAAGTSPLTNVPPGLSNAVAISGGYTHMLALLNAGKPLIVQPPVGGTFYTGAELRLNAAAKGRPPLSFRWYKDGAPVTNATNETFSITTTLGMEAGSYQLVVTNDLGSAQSMAVPVTIVDSAPVLMSQPASRYAWYGSPTAFGASVIGSGPMQLTWFQDGSLVASDANELFFERALPQHQGAYQLIASNQFGSATSSVAQITFSKVAAWGGAPGVTNAPVDLGGVLAVASGYAHALAIRSDRTVAAWGTTANGVTNVPIGLSNVVAVSGGNNFSVALKSDGTVVAWGLGTSGQTNVPAGLSNVVAVSAGGLHALALRANGTVAAWGPATYAVTNVPASLSNVVAIAAGSVHSLALKDDGTVVPWGIYGTPPILTNIVAISAGFNHSLALQADGTVLGWTTAKLPARRPVSATWSPSAPVAATQVITSTWLCAQTARSLPGATTTCWAKRVCRPTY
jgi:alpha-tubulin suppressor-like RCC1 family protein